jgi:hypothetical protein
MPPRRKTRTSFNSFKLPDGSGGGTRRSSFGGGGGGHPPSLGQLQARSSQVPRSQHELSKRESMEEEGVLYTVRVMVSALCVFGGTATLRQTKHL